MQVNGTITDDQLKDAAMGEATYTPSATPKFTVDSAMSLKIRLPDGRVVSVQDATEQEFRAYVSDIVSRVAAVVGDGKTLNNNKENVLATLRSLRSESVDDEIGKWYVLLELVRALAWLRHRHHCTIELFVK